MAHLVTHVFLIFYTTQLLLNLAGDDGICYLLIEALAVNGAFYDLADIADSEYSDLQVSIIFNLSTVRNPSSCRRTNNSRALWAY
jgi:hypothetical protein